MTFMAVASEVVRLPTSEPRIPNCGLCWMMVQSVHGEGEKPWSIRRPTVCRLADCAFKFHSSFAHCRGEAAIPSLLFRKDSVGSFRREETGQ